ncbi:MAG TPA: hypothetical protein DDW62_09570, partial [Marinilabiliaceae bacterium]|nr:hypothetical protein [Marinilabiliaceae bacterium]
FGIRKRLLEYDDVMNSQREVIYTKRRRALYGERMHVEISNMMYDIVEGLIADYQDSGDLETFKMELIRIFSTEIQYSAEDFANEKP